MDNPIKHLINSNFIDLQIHIIYSQISFTHKINEIEDNLKIIIIDNYKAQNQIIIVGCNFIFIVYPNLLHLFQFFFQKNKSSLLYFLNDSQKIFDSNIQIEYKKATEDERILSTEIYGLMQYITAGKGTELSSIFFKMTLQSIVAFAIRRAYLKSKKNKIDSYFSKDLDKSKPFKNRIYNKNEFIVLRLIGSGYSSTVSLMYHFEKCKLFAIKTFKNQNKDCFDLQQREINNFSKISHPFILKFYGVIDHKNDSQPNSLVLEFIDGKSLSDIHKLKLNEKEKIKIIFQIMIVLEYFHNNDLVYRDLKPNNIMINQDKTVVFIDFDRMIDLKQNRKMDEFTNDFSSDFAANELNYGYISCKCDIYSLGLMIYFIIMETSPKISHKKSAFKFPSKYSKLESICYKCTLDNPKERPCISELIDFFYVNYFSKIHVNDLFQINYNNEKELFELSEINTIKTIKNIHNNSFMQYWAFLSEYNSSKSLFYFYSIYFDDETNVFQKDNKKYIKYLILSANRNNEYSRYMLAFHYYNGLLLKENIQKAIQILLSLELRVEFNEGQCLLGNLYLEGKELPKDINKSLYYYYIAANNNNETAQYFLGYQYYYGYLVNRDIDRSIFYLTLSANQNCDQAQYLLGLIYQDSQSNRINNNKSIMYLNLAHIQNNLDARLLLANMYLSGYYVTKDIDTAIYYYTLAANQNSLVAISNLSSIYFKKKDYNKAIYYFERAKDLNLPCAYSALGCLYYEGNFVVRDVNKGIYYLEIAAKNNEPVAFYNLANIYHYGLYIKKDINKAIYYYKRASECDIPMAHNTLGNFYIDENYEGFDVEKSIHYYELGAKQGYYLSLYNLGIIYLAGKYVEQNYNKAIHYLTLASNLNCKLAKEVLGILYLNGEIIPRNIKKAINYLETAASSFDYDKYFYYNKDNMKKHLNFNSQKLLDFDIYLIENMKSSKSYRSMLILALLYHEGKLVEQDIDKAIHYYKESILFANEFSKNNLGAIYRSGYKAPKNLSLSIEYFNEAINQNDSFVSRYNLASIYIFENNNADDNIDKSIELLIKSFNQGFYPSADLLCLALTIKYKNNLSFDIIHDTLCQYKNKIDSLNYLIFQYYTNLNLENKSNFNDYYKKLENVSYVFTLDSIVESSCIEKCNFVQNKVLNNINEHFFEGFGLDLL